MKQRTKIYVIGLLALLMILLVTLYFSAINRKPKNTQSLASSNTPSGTAVIFETPQSKMIESPIVVESYSYLFESTRLDRTSNIVGYFGYGAFAWYVPDWLAQNWTSIQTANKADMTFAPNIRKNESDFSDIVFTIATSTETFNAASLFDEVVASMEPKNLIVNEVVLNKHTEGGMTIVMETNTRIYHIQMADAGRMKDIYYMDGNSKTLTITFDSRADIFQQFSTQIRNMVEGIGEIKAPQG